MKPANVPVRNVRLRAAEGKLKEAVADLRAAEKQFERAEDAPEPLTLTDEQRAAAHLTSATTAAEVLEARELAAAAYDAAKRAGRFAKAKQAHDDVISAVYRAQADALEIESLAKRRLADEYDAAQERGEVATGSVRTDIVPQGNDVRPSTAADLGLTHDDVISAVYRAQADALEIESLAKRRLADEYDAAQEHGEVGQSGARHNLVPNGNEVVPTAADIGLTRKDVHDARSPARGSL